MVSLPESNKYLSADELDRIFRNSRESVDYLSEFDESLVVAAVFGRVVRQTQLIQMTYLLSIREVNQVNMREVISLT